MTFFLIKHVNIEKKLHVLIFNYYNLRILNDRIVISLVANVECMVRKGLRASNLSSYHPNLMRVILLENL
jgi:hypothetical protein